MERLTIADLDPWLLSGQPVVRLKGRDFDQSLDEFQSWLSSLAATLNLGIAAHRISDPPGFVVQAYKPGTRVPKLEDPMIKATKANTPWLFCIGNKCRNRVTVPGMPCQAHA